MLRNILCILASAAQRPAASAAVFSLWLAWSLSMAQLSNKRAVAANPWLFAASDDASSSASLARAKRRDGGETLSGRTQFQLRGAVRSIIVEESAEVAADGRLRRAEVHLRYLARGTEPLPKDLIAEAIFDESAGLVRTLDQEGVTRARQVATSVPWVYLPVSLPSGSTLSTPVAVVVARAAARAALDVLRVSVDSEVSISTDQLWVSGTNEDWVLLGDDLATFSCDSLACDELVKLHVAALGSDLMPHATTRASLR
jgi:hypothetical protein